MPGNWQRHLIRKLGQHDDIGSIIMFDILAPSLIYKAILGAHAQGALWLGVQPGAASFAKPATAQGRVLNWERLESTPQMNDWTSWSGALPLQIGHRSSVASGFAVQDGCLSGPNPAAASFFGTYFALRLIYIVFKLIYLS